MMKYSLVLLLFLFVIPSLQCQIEFGVEGTIYKYLGEEEFFPGQPYRPYITTIEFENDTIIANQECKKVKVGFRLNWRCNGDTTEYKYMYESDGEVYIFNPIINQFDLLYDFNKNAGESYIVPAFCNGEGFTCESDELIATIDSVTFEQIGDSLLRVQHTSVYFPYFGVDTPFKIYEGIGCLEHFLFFKSYYCTTAHDRILGLRCFDSPALGTLKFFDDSGTCDDLVNSNDIVLDEKIHVFPNPFNNNIEIDFDDQYDMFLCDINGKELFRLESNNGNITVETNKLMKGVYILIVETDGAIYTEKLVKN